MNLSVLHRRLMQDVLEIGNSLPLVITGGYAVQAHELVDRPSRDIDVATDSGIPMEDIAAAVVAGLTARGWDVRIIGVDPRSARMMATDPATSEQCELDILREVFSQPPAVTPYGPVLALYDVIGTKVRALVPLTELTARTYRILGQQPRSVASFRACDVRARQEESGSAGCAARWEAARDWGSLGALSAT
jgi:hypothetical protein